MRSGLGGPIPTVITLVTVGRCRPTPDRMSEGASSDRHRGRLVAVCGATRSGEGLLPVLGSPHRGVGGIDSDHADTGLRAHAEQPRAEFAGGDTGDELSE